MSSSPTIPTLLERGQHQTLHWFPDDVAPETLAETMVGMANRDGGTILLGISPRGGRISGVRNAAALFDTVFQASLLADPSLIVPMPTLQTAEGVQVMVLTIPAGLPNVYSIHGRYYQREGRHTTTLSPNHLRELLMARGVVQFESQTPDGATFDDLNPDAINAYLDQLALPAPQKPEDILMRRGCAKLVDGIARPTYAALLLFGRHPHQWLPNATLLAARFSGIAFSDEYIKQDIGGTLPEQIRQGDQFVRTNLRSVVRMTGLTHQDEPEYPPEAVRELLVNAVAHRDYNIQGDTVHLHIFADRLEVLSPGGLPGPVTLDNLLIARFSRNPVIVQVLSDMGFVERLGYGLERVVTAMKRAGQDDPDFEETAGRFRVTLRGKASPSTHAQPDITRYADLALNPRQEMVLNYLRTYPRITNRAYQELCPDVHPETLRRDLASLVSKNVLLKIGNKKATYYILKK